jgi:hypothetical protein
MMPMPPYAPQRAVGVPVAPFPPTSLGTARARRFDFEMNIRFPTDSRDGYGAETAEIGRKYVIKK